MQKLKSDQLKNELFLRSQLLTLASSMSALKSTYAKFFSSIVGYVKFNLNFRNILSRLCLIF